MEEDTKEGARMGIGDCIVEREGEDWEYEEVVPRDKFEEAI
jgi:hypothetical protein